jgi:hypothetical protein
LRKNSVLGGHIALTPRNDGESICDS